MSRLALGVTEMLNGNEIKAPVLVVAPCTGLAKKCDPAMALIHASEIDRSGPGPTTPRATEPMAADVGVDPTAAVLEGAGLDVVVALEPAVAAAGVPGVSVVPVNVCTWAPVGVMPTSWFQTSGQSMAELST